MEIEDVGDAIGGDAQRVAGAGVGVDAVDVVELDAAVVVVRDADEHAGIGAGQTVAHLAGVFERFPRDLEQHALLRVHSGSLARRDTKEVRVELVDVVDEAAEARDDFARGGRIGIVIIVEAEAIGGNFADGVDAALQQVPESESILCARKAASDADDRDRVFVALANRDRVCIFIVMAAGVDEISGSARRRASASMVGNS